MIYDARARRRKGGLSDADDLGCGYLAITAETDEERKWLTALYLINAPVNAPAIPRNEGRKRELKAVQIVQCWLTQQRKAIRSNPNER